MTRRDAPLTFAVSDRFSLEILVLKERQPAMAISSIPASPTKKSMDSPAVSPSLEQPVIVGW